MLESVSDLAIATRDAVLDLIDGTITVGETNAIHRGVQLVLRQAEFSRRYPNPSNQKRSPKLLLGMD